MCGKVYELREDYRRDYLQFHRQMLPKIAFKIYLHHLYNTDI